MITLGLCCICNALKREGVSFRTMTYAGFCALPKARRIPELSARILHNARVVERILAFLAENHIRHYRLSSSLLPLLTHPKLRLPPEKLHDFPEIKKTFARAGLFAKTRGISLSMHPGQFVILPTTNPATLRATLDDLEQHGQILDWLGAPRSYAAPINLHMGTSNEWDALPMRFDAAYKKLSPAVRRRLVFENEDKGRWNARVLLDFLKPRKLPLTFDFLHDACNPCGEPQRDLFFESAATWGKCTPVFHYAESLSPQAPRSHSDFLQNAPPDYGLPYTCELEAKAKDDALIALRAQFSRTLR